MSNEMMVRNEFSVGIFADVAAFEDAQRMAKALAASTLVPKDYQGNVPNCLIAISMAMRLKIDPMMVMQNLYIVNGRPAWSSQYITAMINSSGRYKSALKFEFVGTKGKPDYGCRAWVMDGGDKLEGPTITMEMADAEGWTKKNGSKWATMPDIMMCYRAASFFGRLYCSDLLMGIMSSDEAADIPADVVEPNSVPMGFDDPEPVQVEADTVEEEGPGF